jgi:hypothetical protein
VVTEVDEQLREEARRFELCFTCETCAHFDPAAVRCASGYPTEPHRGIRLAEARSIVFCKEYELS